MSRSSNMEDRILDRLMQKLTQQRQLGGDAPISTHGGEYQEQLRQPRPLHNPREGNDRKSPTSRQMQRRNARNPRESIGNNSKNTFSRVISKIKSKT